MVPSLTTVRINGEQIGAVAAQFLIDRAENRTIANPIVNVGYSIIVRESA
jgi:LacI family gluconate utilization system Gnt-I transcriptional repressor